MGGEERDEGREGNKGEKRKGGKVRKGGGEMERGGGGGGNEGREELNSNAYPESTKWCVFIVGESTTCGALTILLWSPPDNCILPVLQ